MKTFKQEQANFSRPNDKEFYLYIIEQGGNLHTVLKESDGSFFPETIGYGSSGLEVTNEKTLAALFKQCTNYTDCKVYEFESMSDLILFCLKNQKKIEKN